MELEKEIIEKNWIPLDNYTATPNRVECNYVKGEIPREFRVISGTEINGNMGSEQIVLATIFIAEDDTPENDVLTLGELLAIITARFSYSIAIRETDDWAQYSTLVALATSLNPRLYERNPKVETSNGPVAVALSNSEGKKYSHVDEIISLVSYNRVPMYYREGTGRPNEFFIVDRSTLEKKTSLELADNPQQPICMNEVDLMHILYYHFLYSNVSTGNQVYPDRSLIRLESVIRNHDVYGEGKKAE